MLSSSPKVCLQYKTREFYFNIPTFCMSFKCSFWKTNLQFSYWVFIYPVRRTRKLSKWSLEPDFFQIKLGWCDVVKWKIYRFVGSTSTHFFLDWICCIFGIIQVFVFYCVASFALLLLLALLSNIFFLSFFPGTKEERAVNSLKSMGPAILNGGITTFLALVLLGFSQSHVFITFFKASVLSVMKQSMKLIRDFWKKMQQHPFKKVGRLKSLWIIDLILLAKLKILKEERMHLAQPQRLLWKMW